MPDRERRRRAHERLIGLFALGCLLFSPPLAVLAGGGTVLGLPSGYAYLFVSWLVIVLGLALVVERRARAPRSRRP